MLVGFSDLGFESFDFIESNSVKRVFVDSDRLIIIILYGEGGQTLNSRSFKRDEIERVFYDVCQRIDCLNAGYNEDGVKVSFDREDD